MRRRRKKDQSHHNTKRRWRAGPPHTKYTDERRRTPQQAANPASRGARRKPEEGNKDTHPTGTIATAKSLHEAIALVRQGGDKDAVAGVLRLKEEVTDLAVGEHPWSMLAEQDRHDEKLAQWKRLLELAKSRATAARQDQVGITSHVFTMSSKERWKDIRARDGQDADCLDGVEKYLTVSLNVVHPIRQED